MSKNKLLRKVIKIYITDETDDSREYVGSWAGAVKREIMLQMQLAKKIEIDEFFVMVKCFYI